MVVSDFSHQSLCTCDSSMKMDIPQAAQSEENCEGSYDSIIITTIIFLFQTKEISVNRENILH